MLVPTLTITDNLPKTSYLQTLSLFKECLEVELTDGLLKSKQADRMQYESEEQAVALAKVNAVHTFAELQSH